ncbi:MAG: IclR family transcriptional regulator [Actinomycetota bacterium]|nr:IclR family transcriptional regulator [Actinomycetota bacterium]
MASHDEVGLAALGREAGLQPSTVHRLLTTLMACGYVMQNKRTGRYQLSHKIVGLAGGPELRIARLRAIAYPHLEAIRDHSDETTNLVVLERFSTVYVDQAESSRAVRMFTQIGRRVVAHATGGGKAVLAFQSDEVRADLLAAAPYAKLTPHTITGATAMGQELERIQARGYAIDEQEYEADVGCVGVPILDDDGHAIAAISVSAPLARFQRLDMVKLAAFMTSRTREMSHELGYRGSNPSHKSAA